MQNKLQKGDVLLFVDPQYDFLPGGALGIDEADKIIPIINQWIQAAEKENIPVILSRDWHPPHHISFKERGGPWPPHCVQNTHGAAFHTDIQIPKNVLIIEKAFDPDKDAYSAFEGVTHKGRIPLAQTLKELHAKRIWIGGLAFDYCVHFTALDARKLNYEVHVILPACRSISLKTEQKSFQDMVQAGVIMEL